MADKDLGNPDGPSLELPSFGFGRKRRKKTAPEPVEETVVDEAVADEEPPAAESDEPEVDEAVAEAVDTDVAGAQDEAVDVDVDVAVGPNATAEPNDVDEAVAEAGAVADEEPGASDDPETIFDAAPTDLDDAADESAPETEAHDDAEPTVVLPDLAPAATIPGASAAAAAVAREVSEIEGADDTSPEPVTELTAEIDLEEAADLDDPALDDPALDDPALDGPGLDDPDLAAREEAEEGPGLRDRFEPLMKFPELAGRPAAAATGAVIGVLSVVATFASLRLCGLVKGTTSCGGPGLILLIAILVGLVYLGSFLLRGFKQPDPFSTSFLAVGLLAVVALLFLVDVLFSWTMIIVIPLVAAGTYVLSHWVTTTFIEPAREEHEYVDL